MLSRGPRTSRFADEDVPLSGLTVGVVPFALMRTCCDLLYRKNMQRDRLLNMTKSQFPILNRWLRSLTLSVAMLSLSATSLMVSMPVIFARTQGTAPVLVVVNIA